MISVSPPNKNYCPYYKTFKPSDAETLEDVKEIIMDDVSWSPVIFNDNQRQQKNFREANLIVLDIDDGLSLENCIESVKHFSHIIGTTKSHQKEKNGKVCDRYRVILATTAPCHSLLDYKVTIKYYTNLLGADRAATDGARYFFKCNDIVSFNEYGERIQWSKSSQLPTYKKHVPEMPKSGIPYSVSNLLNGSRLCRSGSRHHTLFHVAAVFGRYGTDIGQVEHKIVNSALGAELIDFHNGNVEEILRNVRNGYRKGQEENG